MRVIINHSYTDLNTYINKERTNRYMGAKIKKEQTQFSEWKTQYESHKLKYPLKIIFTWHIKNQRKDPDNIAFAKKFVLDGFVKSGFLDGDGQKQIASFEDKFEIDEEEYVEVELLET